MHNKVVYRMARGLQRRGSVVLRFNFRGVARSEGQHAGSAGEVEEGCAPGGAVRLIAVGLPTRADCDTRFLETCHPPKFLIPITHDEYAPAGEREALFALVAQPKALIWVEARDHFFAGAMDSLEEAVFKLG